MSIEQSYNYKAITDSLTTSGLINTEQLQQLSQQQYQCVINLLPNDSQYATDNEQQLVETQQINYVYIPVDFSNPSLKDYQAFTSALNKHIHLKTHIHCAANYRVSAFFGIYAHQHLNWSVAQVTQHVEALWQPEEHPPWLALLKQLIEDY